MRDRVYLYRMPLGWRIWHPSVLFSSAKAFLDGTLGQNPAVLLRQVQERSRQHSCLVKMSYDNRIGRYARELQATQVNLEMEQAQWEILKKKSPLKPGFLLSALAAFSVLPLIYLESMLLARMTQVWGLGDEPEQRWAAFMIVVVFTIMLEAVRRTLTAEPENAQGPPNRPTWRRRAFVAFEIASIALTIFGLSTIGLLRATELTFSVGQNNPQAEFLAKHPSLANVGLVSLTALLALAASICLDEACHGLGFAWEWRKRVAKVVRLRRRLAEMRVQAAFAESDCEEFLSLVRARCCEKGEAAFRLYSRGSKCGQLPDFWSRIARCAAVAVLLVAGCALVNSTMSRVVPSILSRLIVYAGGLTGSVLLFASHHLKRPASPESWSVVKSLKQSRPALSVAVLDPEPKASWAKKAAPNTVRNSIKKGRTARGR